MLRVRTGMKLLELDGLKKIVRPKYARLAFVSWKWFISEVSFKVTSQGGRCALRPIMDYGTAIKNAFLIHSQGFRWLFLTVSPPPCLAVSAAHLMMGSLFLCSTVERVFFQTSVVCLCYCFQVLPNQGSLICPPGKSDLVGPTNNWLHVISMCFIFHFLQNSQNCFLQKPLPVAGLPLLKTQENHLGWESVHLDPNEPGAMGYLGTLEHFALEHVATVNISFDEDYYPK